MKKSTLGLSVMLGLTTIFLTGCNSNTENNIEEGNVGIANPASVYCEQNGGTLLIQDSENGAIGICKFEDESYCEEWAFYRGECQMNNSDVISSSEMYSEKEISEAIAAISDIVDNQREVKVEMEKIEYLGDKKAIDELNYCKELDETVDECAVFTSNFHIPEIYTELAGGFEPGSDISGWTWYLGRATDGEWKVLTRGF